jgi:hypothetical protein
MQQEQQIMKEEMIKLQKKNSMYLSSQLGTFKNLTANALKSIYNIQTTVTNKQWSQYSRQHQIAKKKQYHEEIKAAGSLCKSCLFEPTEIHLKNKETNESLVIDIKSGACKEKIIEQTTSNIPTATSYVKDKFTIPHCAYHEINLLTKDLPRQHELKEASKIYNQKSVIESCPNGIVGVQQSLEHRLLIRLRHYTKQATHKAVW